MSKKKGDYLLLGIDEKDRICIRKDKVSADAYKIALYGRYLCINSTKLFKMLFPEKEDYEVSKTFSIKPETDPETGEEWFRLNRIWKRGGCNILPSKKFLPQVVKGYR